MAWALWPPGFRSLACPGSVTPSFSKLGPVPGGGGGLGPPNPAPGAGKRGAQLGAAAARDPPRTPDPRERAPRRCFEPLARRVFGFWGPGGGRFSQWARGRNWGVREKSGGRRAHERDGPPGRPSSWLTPFGPPHPQGLFDLCLCPPTAGTENHVFWTPKTRLTRKGLGHGFREKPKIFEFPRIRPRPHQKLGDLPGCSVTGDLGLCGASPLRGEGIYRADTTLPVESFGGYTG